MIRYLTPDEAAGELLGWTGKWRGQALLRIVLRKERQESREIAVRVKGEQRVRYKLTEPMLKLHFPELFLPQVEALAKELHRKIDDIKATIGAEVDERMAPQIQRIRVEHTDLVGEVTQLASNTNDRFRKIELRMAVLEGK